MFFSKWLVNMNPDWLGYCQDNGSSSFIKHCGEARNCSLQAFSPFFTVISKKKKKYLYRYDKTLYMYLSIGKLREKKVGQGK